MSEGQQNQINIDLMIDKTKEQIVQVLNDSSLTIGIMAMILRELSNEVTNQANVQLRTLKHGREGTDDKEGS